MAVSVTGLVFEDDAELGVYESSDYGERCFCKKCGTSLMWRMKDGSHYSMSAHAFYDPSIFKFTKEIFVDDQPTNYAFANATKRLTGAQVIAMFEGQAEGQANG